MSRGFLKAIVYSSFDEGRRLVDFVHINSRGTPGLWKTAAAREYSPEIMEHVHVLRPQPGKVYPLINALGAGEVWSSNKNSDFFEESELCPADPTADYGYKTFERYARAFKHHINKPDSPAYGTVLHAVFNPRMHRVELLVCLDRSSAPDIAEQIEAGEDVPVSMGCKVPYDVCSICGNQAKSADEYCTDMRKSPGRILDDGRKVFVYNPRPKFFDISFVFVGADRTARVMAKVASEQPRFPSWVWAQKMGYHDKDADIVKRLDGQASNALKSRLPALDKGLKMLASREARLSGEPIDKIGRACVEARGGPGKTALAAGLATLTQAGIVLSPAEFQQLAGVTLLGPEKLAGLPTMAEEPYDLEVYAAALSDPEFDLGLSQTDPEVAVEVAPWVEKRSAFQPFLGGRAASLLEAPAEAPGAASVGNVTPLLGSLAALYAAYRDRIPGTEMGLLDKLVAKNPALLVLLAGLTAGGVLGADAYLSRLSGPADGAMKTGAPGVLARVLGIPALAYLYSGHQQRRRWTGEELGPVDQFMADYPMFASIAGIGLLPQASQLLGAGKFASLIPNCRQDALRSCGDRQLMDYKAALDILVLAERPA